jgi:adenosylmethionine-8-amino-7-oxononanoate aminotransferase
MARGGIVNLIKNENLTSDYILANNNLLFDQQHIWHPYTSAIDPLACYEVIKAEG